MNHEYHKVDRVVARATNRPSAKASKRLDGYLRAQDYEDEFRAASDSIYLDV
jgi:hypothetical protein